MRNHRRRFPMQKMAEILKVSHSGYYRFLQRSEKGFDEELFKTIKTIFQEHKGRYGAPRIHFELQKHKIPFSRYKVEKLMTIKGLRATRNRKRIKTTIPCKKGKDMIKRNFAAEKANQKWCSDITYLPTKRGFVYLAAIMDLYSRKVVGACVLEHMEQSLVV